MTMLVAISESSGAEWRVWPDPEEIPSGAVQEARSYLFELRNCAEAAAAYELYELWCYLRLVRAAVELFGPAAVDLRDLFVSDALGGVTLSAGAAVVAVGGGWELCFQKHYQEFWVEPDGRGSFSRTMTPDIVARSPTPAGQEHRLIVLDAKYRIDEGLNDALSSIHTYRDALVQDAGTGQVKGIVSAAYLLAPYIPELRAGYRETPLPGRLFHPEYRRGFRFGAVTLRPGMGGPAMAAALKAVVADSIAPGAP